MKILENFHLQIVGAPQLKGAMRPEVTHLLSFTHIGNKEHVVVEHTANTKTVVLYDAYLKSHEKMGYTLPTKTQIEDIIHWFHDIELQHSQGKRVGVVCQCQWGISRSTALAYVLLVMITGDVGLSAKLLLEIRPIATPNPLMLKLAEDVLNIDMSSTLRRYPNVLRNLD